MKAKEIECVAVKLELDIGDGNRLLLFQGDKVRVVPRPASQGKQKGLYAVQDHQFNPIGYLNRKDIRRITGKSVEKLMEARNGTLVPQR